MHRPVNQLRPQGDPTAFPYAPQRDLAFIYTPMLREVFEGLDEKNWTPYFKAWFDKEGITEEQLGQAVTVFMEAHRLFIRDREVTSPADAFTQAGAAQLPDAVKYALFCRLGEVLTGGFFVGLRDVTQQGQQSSIADDMAAMIAAGRELSQRLSGQLAKYTVGDVERLRAAADENRRVIKQVHGLLIENDKEIHHHKNEVTRLQRAWAGLDRLHTPVRIAQQANWFRRLFTAAGIAWKVYWKQLL